MLSWGDPVQDAAGPSCLWTSPKSAAPRRYVLADRRLGLPIGVLRAGAVCTNVSLASGLRVFGRFLVADGSPQVVKGAAARCAAPHTCAHTAVKARWSVRCTLGVCMNC